MSQVGEQKRNSLIAPSQSFFAKVKKKKLEIKLGIYFTLSSFLLSSPSSFCSIFPAEKKITTQLEGDIPPEGAGN